MFIFAREVFGRQQQSRANIYVVCRIVLATWLVMSSKRFSSRFEKMNCMFEGIIRFEGLEIEAQNVI